MAKRFWTAYEDEVLKRLYPNTKTGDLALYFGRALSSVYNRAAWLGLAKSAAWLASGEACLLKRLPETGLKGRFKPGQTPWNKGAKHGKGWAPGRMAETQFKKGQLNGQAARRWKPIGSVRLSKEGYVKVKFREREGRYGNWKGTHVLRWEEAHGPTPKGHKVAFKDGDKTHVWLDNLELISNAEMMRRNSVHNLPKELADVIQLAGALKRKVREMREKQVERSAQPFV